MRLKIRAIKRFYCVGREEVEKIFWPLTLCLDGQFVTSAYIFIVFPSYSQGRKVLFDGITNSGMKFIDYIPRRLIKTINSQELKITLINGSIIQVIGSDSYDSSLIGTNPIMCVFSEFALSDPDAFKFVRPILNANNGSFIVISTPRGKNTFWDLYQTGLNSPDWFVQKLTILDTGHIPLEMIQKDVDEGICSPDLIEQEYYCSFERGAEGAYFSRYIDKLRLNGQIGRVQWEPSFPVHTAFDIGVTDSTCIIFFQLIGRSIHIIDSYSKNKEGLEHYVNLINSKPYSYGKHWVPADVSVKEWGSGLTRLEKARQLGLKFETRDNGSRSALPNLSIEDGIEAVRSSLPKMWFDEEKCKPLIKALENYRQEFNNKLKVYRNTPLHDESSHFADAMRYLCLSLSRNRDAMSTPEELDRRYREASSGGSDGMDSSEGFFRNGPGGF